MVFGIICAIQYNIIPTQTYHYLKLLDQLTSDTGRGVHLLYVFVTASAPVKIWVIVLGTMYTFIYIYIYDIYFTNKKTSVSSIHRILIVCLVKKKCYHNIISNTFNMYETKFYGDPSTVRGNKWNRIYFFFLFKLI